MQVTNRTPAPHTVTQLNASTCGIKRYAYHMGVLRVALQKIILVRQVSSTLLEHINLDIVLSSWEEGRYSCFLIVYGVSSNCMFHVLYCIVVILAIFTYFR